jgi:glycosyltransferase involved in cell wall biosynthesis
MEIPLVSVCIITYQHVEFIRKCLDGALMQRTDFLYEIIVGEDESNDGTREICKEYAEAYPDRIRLFLRSRKDVIYVNGTPVGRYNFIECIKAVKGKYIAICEGDDYWTDPLKLQKQVDFLEKNPDFSICFHNAKILNEENPNESGYSNSPNQSEICSFDDLAKGEFIYTATCIFHTSDFKKFPEKYYFFINNYTLDLHNAQYGKIKYFNEVMSVYRKHRGGIWSMVSREKTLINQLPTYKFYVYYFDRKYKHYFIRHLRNITSELVSILATKKDYKRFWQHYWEYVKYNVTDSRKIATIIYLFFKISFVTLRQKIRKNA